VCLKFAFSLEFIYNNGMEKMTFEGLPAPVIEYISSLENRLDKLVSQIDRLTELLILAQKAQFGSSSEKAKYLLEDEFEQETLFNEAEAYADEDEPDRVIIERHERKPKRTKADLAKELPVKKVVIDLSEDERVCDICKDKGDLQAIGEEFVRSELNIIPAQAFIENTYRKNYCCNRCHEETDEANIIKPEVPTPVVKRGLASPSSVAHIMYEKYGNAVPLYRQSQSWENFGVIISRATLCNWIIYASNHWLLPLWIALKQILLTSPIILADESRFQVLKEPGKSAQSLSHMWVYCNGAVEHPPPIILFEYQPSRAGEHPKAFLEGAKNIYLQTDGYSAYNAVENVIHCGCFSHQRRKFKEAMPKDAPKDNLARIGFEYCQKLFKLERAFEKLSPEERLERRLNESKPVLEEFFEWTQSANPLSGSKLVEALTYARNQKDKLSAFLLDGRLEISTNRIENMIRPYAVGRKNWLFADTVNGAQSSAIVYSIVRTAVANGLNPYQYLLHLFTHLPTVLTKTPHADLSQFFPWSSEVREKCKFAQDSKGQLTLLS
jgi:transposase